MDESGSDEQALLFEFAFAGRLHPPDRRDDPIDNRDVDYERFAAEPVDDRAVANYQVVGHHLNVRLEN